LAEKIQSWFAELFNPFFPVKTHFRGLISWIARSLNSRSQNFKDSSESDLGERYIPTESVINLLQNWLRVNEIQISKLHPNSLSLKNSILKKWIYDFADPIQDKKKKKDKESILKQLQLNITGPIFLTSSINELIN